MTRLLRMPEHIPVSLRLRSTLFISIGLALLVASDKVLATACISVGNSPLAMLVVPGKRARAINLWQTLRTAALSPGWQSGGAIGINSS